MTWVQPDDLAVHLEIEDAEADGTKTAQLAAALSAAEDQVAQFCGRRFDVATTTASARTFRATSSVLVMVDDFGSLTDLAIATDDNDDGTFETTWDLSDVEVQPLNGQHAGQPWPYYRLVTVDGYWPTRTRRAPIRVTARWGWPEVPDAVRQATILLAAQVYRMKDAPLGVAGFGDTGVVRVRALPMVDALLRPYRRMDITAGIA